MILIKPASALAIILLASAALAVSAVTGAAFAQEKAPNASKPAEASKSPEPQKPAAATQDAKASQYCTNIADAAADARFAWQKQTLASLEKEIEERIKVLEQKRAEYEEWLRRRNEFLAKADESIVAIYSRMRPDAAALQLANMNDDVAAAIIAKLNPRSASAVLNEMEPARAAQLTNILTDKPKQAQDSEKSG
ncbi:MotE family protein [Microvirga subterranea]|uniref:Flagellar motility protein MotE (MotC chaperone) n=1 Tax=Microvirga subterranea TaxID=186651 RepID=A0A370HCP4_9HYPH|nr:MotE family protein [Microvirga subterranea]RDI54848.1 flagellar motility protein MotE (MotC chaperone) [Microvirga subterranea]